MVRRALGPWVLPYRKSRPPTQSSRLWWGQTSIFDNVKYKDLTLTANVNYQDLTLKGGR